MQDINFPKKVQFWVRTVADNLTEDLFKDNRWDLEFPHNFWDNEPKITNIIVHPDPYIFGALHYKFNQEIERLNSPEFFIDWSEKLSKAYFRGAMTGENGVVGKI